MENDENGKWALGEAAGMENGQGAMGKGFRIEGGQGVMGKEAEMENSQREMVYGLNQKKEKKPIRSFRDLEVYQRLYKDSLIVLGQIIPKLPNEERFDLADQLRRACKAAPWLVAEGYAKKHQKAGFQKYLDDAMAEVNEIIVGLNYCKDVYFGYIKPVLSEMLIQSYNSSAKQLYRLREAWANFKRK